MIDFSDQQLEVKRLRGALMVEALHSVTTNDSNTLQWVELTGMPTFDATSTVSALITSMQNPL